MKKINQTKKFQLNCLAISSISAAAVLSACGNDRPTLRFSIPYPVTDKRYGYIQAVVDKYNNELNTKYKNQKGEGYTNGYLPVTMYSANDYFNNSSTIESQLQNKDRYTPNLSLGYGNNIFTANLFHKALDFSRTTAADYPNNAAAKTFNDDGIPKNTYETIFTKINDLIGGVDNGGFYLIPMGASSELMYWSKPVLHYLLTQATTHKLITIKTEDANWFSEQLGVNNTAEAGKSTMVSGSESSVHAYKPNDALAQKIAKYYGSLTKPNASEKNIPITIGKADFQSFTKLFGIMKLLLTHLQNKKPLVSLVQSNLLELMSFLYKDADFSKFLFHKKTNQNVYDYTFFNDQTADQTQESTQPLKTVYDLIKNSVGDHGVWNKAQGSPTTDFKLGQLAFYLNSNSRYKKLFDKTPSTDPNTATLSEKDVLITQEPFYYQDHEEKKNASQKGAFWVQGGSIFAIKSNNPTTDHAVRLFVHWITSAASNAPYDTKDAQAEQYNGADWYALKAGYVPGSTDFWKKGDEKNVQLLTNINKAAAAAYEIFANSSETKTSTTSTLSGASEQKATITPEPTNSNFSWGFKKTNNLVGFLEPVGKLSHTFREVSDANGVGKEIYPSFSEYWKSLTLSNSLIASYLVKLNKNS